MMTWWEVNSVQPESFFMTQCRFKPTQKEMDDSERTWDDDPARDDSVAAEPGLLGTRCRSDSKLPEDSSSCTRDAGREVI